MSSGPTDLARRAAAPLLLAAALAAAGTPPPARAGDEEGGRPVFFRDPTEEASRAMEEAIGLFGSPSPSDRERGRDALHEIGWWSVGRLLAAIKEMQAQFDSNCLLVLGRLGDRRALPAAREVLREDSEWPPVIAALVLGRMKDASDPAMAAFKAALADRKSEKRKVAACLALGKLHRARPAEGGALLEEVLSSPTSNPSVHFAALLALGFYRSRVAEPSEDGMGFRPSRRIQAALADSRSGMQLSAVLAMALSSQDAFYEVFQDVWNDPGADRQARLAALLALGRKEDDRTTEILVDALQGQKSNGEERRMAAYLLHLRAGSLRGGSKAVDALIATARAPRATEVAASAVVALGGVADERVRGVVLGKLNDRSATVRAAAAVACTRFATDADLQAAREALRRKLDAGETDDAARLDMNLAYDEIGNIVRDRSEIANGRKPKERPPVAWLEADADDLFLYLGRAHRERVMDLVNLRVLEVLGIDSLFPYRPNYVPIGTGGGLPGVPGSEGGSQRPRRDHSVYSEQYDVRVELTRRPYYGLEDDPDAVPAAVPREPR